MPLDPVEEAELITAAVAQMQERNPGVAVARVEVYDLAEIEAKGRRCTSCRRPIASCFFIQLCDECLADAFPDAARARP